MQPEMIPRVFPFWKLRGRDEIGGREERRDEEEEAGGACLGSGAEVGSVLGSSGSEMG